MINATKSDTSRCSVLIPITNPRRWSNSAVDLPKILNGEENEWSIAVKAMWLHRDKFNWESSPSTSPFAHSRMRKLLSSKRDSLDFGASSASLLLRAIRGRLFEEVFAKFNVKLRSTGKCWRFVSNAHACVIKTCGGESGGKFSKGDDGGGGSWLNMSKVGCVATRGRLPLKIDGRSRSQNEGSWSLNSEESGGFSLGVKYGMANYKRLARRHTLCPIFWLATKLWTPENMTGALLLVVWLVSPQKSGAHRRATKQFFWKKDLWWTLIIPPYHNGTLSTSRKQANP